MPLADVSTDHTYTHMITHTHTITHTHVSLMFSSEWVLSREKEKEREREREEGKRERKQGLFVTDFDVMT